MAAGAGHCFIVSYSTYADDTVQQISQLLYYSRVLLRDWKHIQRVVQTDQPDLCQSTLYTFLFFQCCLVQETDILLAQPALLLTLRCKINPGGGGVVMENGGNIMTSLSQYPAIFMTVNRELLSTAYSTAASCLTYICFILSLCVFLLKKLLCCVKYYITSNTDEHLMSEMQCDVAASNILTSSDGRWLGSSAQWSVKMFEVLRCRWSWACLNFP